MIVNSKSIKVRHKTHTIRDFCDTVISKQYDNLEQLKMKQINF